MTDLTDFIPEIPKVMPVTEPLEYDEPEEVKVVLLKNASFEQVRDLALQNRKTHPNEPVEWQLDSENNTYTLKKVVVNGTTTRTSS